MIFKITIRKNVVDINNAYKYAVKADEDGYWGGTIGYMSDDSNAVLNQYSIRAIRENDPSEGTFEEIIVSSMFPQNTLTIN